MKALVEMKDAFYRFYLENEINILTNQLQEHKEKEDKLREELLIWGEVMNPTLQNNLLQILNEGSDKNE